MARFCVHRLPDGGHVMDCQSDLLNHLTTRFVVPLIPIEHVGTPMAKLNPIFDVEGQRLVMMTQFSGAVSARSLGKVVLSLWDRDDDIFNALEMLMPVY